MISEDRVTYLLRAGQTAVAKLANDSSVMVKLNFGETVFTVCDESTKKLAVSVLGNCPSQTVVEAAALRCLMTMKQLKEEGSDAFVCCILAANGGKSNYVPDGTDHFESDSVTKLLMDAVKDPDKVEKGKKITPSQKIASELKLTWKKMPPSNSNISECRLDICDGKFRWRDPKDGFYNLNMGKVIALTAEDFRGKKI